MRLKLRLREVMTGNFRKNEATLYREAGGPRLDENECVLFVSRTGTILRFVFGEKSVGAEIVLRSLSYRLLTKATWNPLMLANYASAIGIELVGIKRFEEHYAKLQAGKR